MKPSPNRKNKTPKPHANNTNFESTEFQNNETVTPARHHGKRRAPRLRSSNLKTITHNPKTRKPKDPRTQKPKDPPTQPHPKSDQIRNPIDFLTPEVYTFLNPARYGFNPKPSTRKRRILEQAVAWGRSTKTCLHFSICACHPCAGAILFFCIVPI